MWDRRLGTIYITDGGAALPRKIGLTLIPRCHATLSGVVVVRANRTFVFGERVVW